jgi:hypothetical protein
MTRSSWIVSDHNCATSFHGEQRVDDVLVWGPRGSFLQGMLGMLDRKAPRYSRFPCSTSSQKRKKIVSLLHGFSIRDGQSCKEQTQNCHLGQSCFKPVDLSLKKKIPEN